MTASVTVTSARESRGRQPAHRPSVVGCILRSRRETAEAERLVQGECPSVVDRGVHKAVTSRAVTIHASESSTRPARERPWWRGGDGEALQVALPARRPADGEPDDRLAPTLVPGHVGPGLGGSGWPGGSR